VVLAEATRKVGCSPPIGSLGFINGQSNGEAESRNCSALLEDEMHEFSGGEVVALSVKEPPLLWHFQ
jgi:hypothetical protein